MKKVFQIKLKSIAKVFTLVVAASLVTFTGCKSYDEDITDINGKLNQAITDIATLKTSVAALQTSVNGMTYIKSITMGTDGKLTITPSTGTAIVYDAKNYVTYDIALTNNVLTVNGVNKGTVAIPALTFADGVLKSGTTTVADLTSWLKTGLTVVDGYLAINGQKTSVAIPVAAGKTVKDVAIDGTNVKVTYTDNTTATFANAPIVTSTSADGTLVVNGVDTKVVIKNTYGVDGGFLTVNGVKTTVAIPAENKTSVIFSKDGNGNIISATISDGKDTMVIKVNPSNEALVGLLYAPMIINGGVNAVEVGYINDNLAAKALFNQQEVTFRYNPFNANITDGITWSYVSNTAKFSVAPGVGADKTDLFYAPSAAKVSNVSGAANFDLKVNNWVETGASDVYHLFMLQATRKDIYSGKTATVVSDYVKVMPVQYTAFISNSTPNAVPFIDYPVAKPAITDMSQVYAINYDGGVNTPAIDLKTLVLATANKTVGETALQRKTFLNLGFGTADNEYEFKFDIDDAYLGVDGVTNQNSSLFVTLTGSTLKVTQGFASLDRTPLVRVRLYTKVASPKVAQLLATAYMKFNITGERTVTYNVPPVTISYEKLFKHSTPVAGGIDAALDKTSISIPWEVVNSEIYNKMAITHNDFRIIFPDALLQGATSKVVKFWNPANALTPLTPAQELDVATELVSTLGAVDVDTRKLTYNITPKAKFGKYEITYTFKPAANDKTLKLVYTFTITAPSVDRAILPQYYYLGVNNNKAFTEGVAEGGVYKMRAYIGEFFGFGSTAYRSLFSPSTPTSINWIDGVSHKAEILTSNVSAGASTTGAVLTNTVNTLDGVYGTTTAPKSGADIMLTTPLTTAFRFYNVKVTEYNLPNGETLSNVFDVYFVNPLVIEAKTNPIVMINKTNGSAYTTDLKLNYVVKFKGRNIITYGVNEPVVPAPSYLYYPAAEYGVDASQLSYTVSPVAPYSPTILSLTGTTLKWDNAGGGISTNPLSVGSTSVSITTPFATTSLSVPVQVIPE